MSESSEAPELRGRMAAWDRTFVEARGRRPTEWEWASAARVVGRLPCAQAERLAREVYGTSAEAMPAREECSAERPVACQEQHRASVHAKGEGRALARTAVPIVLAGAAVAAWAAGRGRGKLAA